jgi:hypothetical protein
MAEAAPAETDPATARELAPSWRVIAFRTLAGVFGAYAMTYWIGAALAVLLPIERSERVYLISLLQIFVFVGLVVWIFADSSIRRVTAVMALTIGVCAIPVLLAATGALG